MLNILALGETNHGTHNKEIENVLNSNDFDAIFYELPNDFADYVNEYLKKNIFPERLERYIRGAMNEGNDIRKDLELIFRYSKRKNIPVICIDSSKTKTDKYNKESNVGKWFLNGESRDEDMFNNIKNFIGNKSGSFLLITGAHHLKENVHFRNRTQTLGRRLKEYIGNSLKIEILD